MSKITWLLIALWSTNLIGGNHCGSKEGYLNKLASKYLIPDYFPPKSSLLQRIFGHRNEMKSCLKRFGTAPIYIGCSKHDRCYETKGASKDNCDRVLLQDWLQICRSKYTPSGVLKDPFNQLSSDVCRDLCQNFVNLMSKGQRFNKFGICPSCKAFEKAQKKANALRGQSYVP